MNFFEHQDRARRKTGWLVVLLAAAVTGLIAMTIIVIGFFLYFLQSYSTSVGAYNAQQQSFIEHFSQLLQSPITAWIALGVILVVAGGCLYKFFQLGSNGHKVALSLGGRPIQSNTADFMERKVLNVVEEMAIASGNPVPSVYILDEPGINAFAAGLDRRSAVIGITKGGIQRLNRDELQGVMAHEFSHIHNGDMRLNMRLIALLHGILLIGLIGYYVAYSAGRARSSSKGSAKQLSFGLALMAIGYCGTFFGNMIKAAVSRQREFLADASAVQFTRNPHGISGALQKIGGLKQGSVIDNAHAAEYSHLYFAQGIRSAWTSLLATHPPLAERVLRIDPRWKGSFPKVVDEPAYAASSAEEDMSIARFGADAYTAVTALETALVEIAEEPRAEHLQRAERNVNAIPEKLIQAAHEAFSARALIYGMLLDKGKTLRAKQLQYVKDQAHPVTYKEFMNLLPELVKLPRQTYLTLISLSIPTLKILSNAQYRVFKKNILALVKADRKVTLFEWSLYRIVTKNVEARDLREKHHIGELKAQVSTLLASTSVAGRNHDKLGATNKGMMSLNLDPLCDFPSQASSFAQLDKALDMLEALKPLEKPKLLKALMTVITADGKVTTEEEGLFRAIADSLNCPIPPLY